MPSRTSLYEIQCRKIFIWSFFWDNAYFRHRSAQKWIIIVFYIKKMQTYPGLVLLSVFTGRAGLFRSHMWTKRGDGTIVWNSQGILDSWKLYYERLYQELGTTETNELVPAVELTGEEESNILLDEVRDANAMKKCKAPGCECIEAELWQPGLAWGF